MELDYLSHFTNNSTNSETHCSVKESRASGKIQCFLAAGVIGQQIQLNVAPTTALTVTVGSLDIECPADAKLCTII